MCVKVHFTGDILFNGVTPVMWAGTLEQSAQACDHFAKLSGSSSFLVPGHGPIQHAKQKPLLKMKEYWQHLSMEVSGCKKRNATAEECARKAFRDRPAKYAEWGDAERTLINILVHFENERSPGAPVNKLDFIAKYAALKLMTFHGLS